MSKTLYLSYCFELPADGLPKKIKLIPEGLMLGNDGRAFTNHNPQVILNAFNADPRDLVLDIEHATEIKAPKGEAAPAQGWFKSLEIIDGAVWGELEPNEDGAALISKKNYRYISPAFYHDADGNITSISSVGLTNKPNLNLPSLNREETTMKFSPELCVLLALNSETATEQDVIAGITQLKDDNKTLALNAQQATPDLSKYIPVDTHNLALNRANTAETKLKEIEEAEYTELVDGAIKAGKIAPVNKEMYMSLCRQEGKDKFKTMVDNMAATVNTSGKPEAPQGKKEDAKLTDVELACCRSLNLTEEEFLAAK